MNLSDSERVSAVLEQMGYVHTEREEEASLLGIIACSVRQKPIDKVYNKISQWNRRKTNKNLITFLSGCVLPADKEKLLKQFDIIFEMSELNELPHIIQQYGVVNAASVSPMPQTTQAPQSKIAFKLPASVVMPKNKHINDLWQIKPKYMSSFEAFVPIQNGCDKFCTYCAVPYTRGREVSRASADIIAEVKSLVEQGYKSITLLGQNVNSYGRDKQEETDFAGLLCMIGEFGDSSGKEFWLYFTSPHPQDMTRDVIEVVASYRCLAKQIHLPMQSGDDEVLSKMNRKHSMERYREIVGYVRKLLPEATLFTDVIVGFTGETEEAFENTVNTFHEFRFNMAYIAMYSPRPGAVSYRWEDEVPRPVKNDRLHRLSDVLRLHTAEYNHKLIGKTMRLLVNGTDRKTGFSIGLTEGKLNVRLDNHFPELLGNIVNVKVTATADLSLSGELVMKEEEVKL